jgi:GMP synthase-like glutamine amidotransferase
MSESAAIKELVPPREVALYEAEELPFPFNKTTYCRYEPIEQKVESARVLIVNNLLRYETDLSPLARKEWNGTTEPKLRLERKIASMACDNIAKNIIRLVQHPKTMLVHLSEVTEAVRDFRPQAVVLSGTLSDFDYYNPEHLDKFREFILETEVPVLGICGGHQLVGWAFGAELVTLDHLNPAQKRDGRMLEYQYRFVKITEPNDPIFEGIHDHDSGIWQDYTREGNILRVWQNHGLMLEGVPRGFEILATAYLCKNQMMVKRSDGQLIYAVQFHLEKSFEDWTKNPTRWQHPNESRDGRVLFENFLKLAVKHEITDN